MSNALPTLATCARDAAALIEEGAFIHRRLAEQLFDADVKIWKTDREKTAFVTASPAERASALEAALKEYDAKSGKKPEAPKAEATAPKAEEKPPVEEKKSRRSPQTVADKAPDAKSSNGVHAPAASSDNVQALLLAIKDLSEKIDGISADIAAIGKQVTEQGTSIRAINGLSMVAADLGRINLGLLCLFGEQVLNAPKEAFLEGDAAKYADQAIEILAAQEGKG